MMVYNKPMYGSSIGGTGGGRVASLGVLHHMGGASTQSGLQQNKVKF